MTSNERILYLDIAKGIGIILMVMGHASFGKVFYHYIHGFHMPLFFFVSGLLFTFRSERSGSEIFLGKARTLLVPYAFFGLGTWGIWALTRGGSVSGSDLLAPLKHLLWINSEGLVISGEFWFLSAMFFASLLFDGLFRFVGKPIPRAVILIVLALFGCLFRRVFDIQLPWSLLSAMVGMGFIGIGYFIKQKAAAEGAVKRLFALRWYEITALILITGVLIWFNRPVNMRRSVFSIIPLFWFDAVVMSAVVVNLSMKIENLPLHGIFDYCRNYLVEVGRDSISYLCINSLVLYFLKELYQKFIGKGPDVCRAAICFVLTMAIIYVLNRLIMKTNIRVILGRKLLKSETGKLHAA